MELRNALEAATGSSLPGTLVFDYPTVDSLARYLVERATAREPSAERLDVPSDASSIAWELEGADHHLPVVTIGPIAARIPGALALEDVKLLSGGSSDAVSLTPLSRYEPLLRLYANLGRPR